MSTLADALEKIEAMNKKDWEAFAPSGPAEMAAVVLWKAFLDGDITAGRMVIERLDGRVEQRSAKTKLDETGKVLAEKVNGMFNA